ncbi:MAG TPA: sugar ABC transporter permease [Gaiellaceae bacterium]
MRTTKSRHAGAGAAALVARVQRRSRAPLFAWLMVLPAVAVLLAVTVYPLIYSLRESFYRLELTYSPIPHWVGLQNYVDAFTNDPRFWPALGRSLYLVGFGVAIELVLGFALALALNRLGRPRTLVTALLLVPVMIAPVAVAIEGVVVFNESWGPLNYLLSLIGLNGPIWLGNRTVALKTILLADIWQWTPFVAIIVAAGLRTLPGEVYEAAAVDGASRWQTFRTLTLPLLQPLLIVTVLIRAMDIFKTFDTIFVMTGGGPGSATETASFYTYLQGLRFFSFGYAAAISYIQLIVISVAATILVRRIRKGLG